MIVIHATVTTAPGTAAALKDAIATMEQASRAEPGCIDYTFATALNEPTAIRIFEQWQSIDALKAHFATPHMAAFNAAMQKHPPKGIAVKMFEAKEIPFPPA
ncbi:MAG: antibiotic biosynthesis monooxygenase [Gammaproteobacteria bacterium]|nr:antibiotic biosynthesis monooxygenase [Gammaproteobacteria bacterium]